MGTCNKCGINLALVVADIAKVGVRASGSPRQRWEKRLGQPSAWVCPACDAYALGANRVHGTPFHLPAQSAVATVGDADWWNVQAVDTSGWPRIEEVAMSPRAIGSAIELLDSPVGKRFVRSEGRVGSLSDPSHGLSGLPKDGFEQMPPERLGAAVRLLLDISKAAAPDMPAARNAAARAAWAGKEMLPDATVRKLRDLIPRYRDQVKLPELGRWRALDDAGIWKAVVSQVSVVGGAPQAERMVAKLPAEWYDRLLAMDAQSRSREIHALLRASGIRYAAANPAACRKTRALVENFAFLQMHGGPHAYIKSVAELSSQMQVATISKDLAFIKHKGSRDLLMGLGILKDGIALDVRLLNILKAFGAEFPKGVEADVRLYAQLEQEILTKVCRPEEVNGVMLDRIMFQRYEDILPRGRRTPRDLASAPSSMPSPAPSPIGA